TESEPPCPEVLLVQSLLDDRVIDHGPGLIAQPFTCRHQAVAEFSVLTADQAPTAATQVSTEATILCEHLPTKRHIRPVRSLLFQLEGRIAEIELGTQRATLIPRALKCKPRRWRETCGREDSSSGPGPLAIVQIRSQVP